MNVPDMHCIPVNPHSKSSNPPRVHAAKRFRNPYWFLERIGMHSLLSNLPPWMEFPSLPPSKCTVIDIVYHMCFHVAINLSDAPWYRTMRDSLKYHICLTTSAGNPYEYALDYLRHNRTSSTSRYLGCPLRRLVFKGCSGASHDGFFLPFVVNRKASHHRLPSHCSDPFHSPSAKKNRINSPFSINSSWDYDKYFSLFCRSS